MNVTWDCTMSCVWWLKATSLFLVSSNGWSAFSYTSKSDWGLDVRLQCFFHLTTDSRHMTQSLLFYAHFEQFSTLEQLKSLLFKFFKKLPIIQKICYLAQAYCYWTTNLQSTVLNLCFWLQIYTTSKPRMLVPRPSCVFQWCNDDMWTTDY